MLGYSDDISLSVVRF